MSGDGGATLAHCRSQKRTRDSTPESSVDLILSSDDVAVAIANDGPSTRPQRLSNVPADGSATDDESPTTDVWRIQPGWTSAEYEYARHVATLPGRRRTDGREYRGKEKADSTGRALATRDTELGLTSVGL